MIIKKNPAIWLSILWLTLWVFPWGQWLSFETNILLTFIIGLIKLVAALVLFILPGTFIYLLCINSREEKMVFLGLMPIGFSLSIMLIGTIGLMGRLVGLSFFIVKILFSLIGLISFILVYKKNSNTTTSDLIIYFRSSLKNWILWFAIVLSIFLTFTDVLFFIDDTTYLAYLTNWQYSENLGFRNIIHESTVLELERFWLAMYPMSQAILSELSGIPGILLFSNYLELLLVPMAVVTAYWFARQIGFTKRAAAISTLIQISLFSWMIGEEWPVGTWFYNSLAEDKVASVFHLAPVFIIFVVKYFEASSRTNLLLAFLTGFAITLTHPVSLFFTCVIVVWLALLAFIFKEIKLSQVVVSILLVGLLMSPYLVIRLANLSSQAGFVAGTAQSGGGAYELDRYTYVLNDIFYGLNPGVLQFIDLELGASILVFRLIPVYILILTFGVSLVNLKNGKMYWYIFCSAILVILVTIPYTGWIFGYFTDARLIFRASWFMPLGLGTVICLQALLKLNSKNKVFITLNRNIVIVFICFLFVLPILVFFNLTRVSLFFQVMDRNTQLAEIGKYIDTQTYEPIVSTAIDYADMLLLPGVSAHTRLISFREEKLDNGHNHYLTEAEIEERIYASNVIRSLKTDDKTSQERCAFIDEYNVEFVIADNKDADLYLELVSKCGIAVEKIYQTKDKALLQIQP